MGGTRATDTSLVRHTRGVVVGRLALLQSTAVQSAIGEWPDFDGGCTVFCTGNFTDGFRQDAYDLFLMNYRCDLDGRRPAARGGVGDDSGSSGDNAVRNLSTGYQIKWQLKVFAVLIGRCRRCAQRLPCPLFLQT
jgi:hypothetical protein